MIRWYPLTPREASRGDAHRTIWGIWHPSIDRLGGVVSEVVELFDYVVRIAALEVPYIEVTTGTYRLPGVSAFAEGELPDVVCFAPQNGQETRAEHAIVEGGARIARRMKQDTMIRSPLTPHQRFPARALANVPNVN